MLSVEKLVTQPILRKLEEVLDRHLDGRKAGGPWAHEGHCRARTESAPPILVFPSQADRLRRFRAALEAPAYLIALGVRQHESSGQRVRRVSVSGGIARSDLMCEILASVLDRPLERLQSSEGPALGAAVTALAALETHLRRRQGVEAPFTVADAVAVLVRFREPVAPNPAWREAYRAGLRAFEERLGG